MINGAFMNSPVAQWVIAYQATGQQICEPPVPVGGAKPLKIMPVDSAAKAGRDIIAFHPGSTKAIAAGSVGSDLDPGEPFFMYVEHGTTLVTHPQPHCTRRQ